MRLSITAFGGAADRRTASLRHMTADQLRGLGTHQVAYLRTGTYDDRRLLVLYGADGEPLVLVDDIEAAFEVAAGHGLKFVAVH